MGKIPDHIHTYKRINLARKAGKEDYWVFRCVTPGCSHYIRQDMALGVLAKCNRCKKPFIIDKETILLAKPHCQDCIKRKKITPTNLDKLAELVKDI